MEKDLIKNSQELVSLAHEVLIKTSAVEIFSSIGKVETIGSLRLNLMYRCDIDLFVVSETIDKDKALKITKQFLDSGIFRIVALADYKNHPAYDTPFGCYWELIIPYKGKDWKFDVWYLKPEEAYAKLIHESIEKFEKLLKQYPERRETILRIKDAYYDGVKYKDKVKGIDIYKAVLEDGVSNLDEFDKIIKNRP